VFSAPEYESEATRLPLHASDVDALHGVDVELPDLQRSRQVRIHVHGDKEALDSRRCTASHFDEDVVRLTSRHLLRVTDDVDVTASDVDLTRARATYRDACKLNK